MLGAPGRRPVGSAYSTRGLAWRVLALVVLVGLVVVSFVFLRPRALGGSTEYVAVHGISMTPTIHDGDVAVVEKESSYHLGEIVVYQIPAGEPGAGEDVIHRIVGGDGVTGFVTKGDHNSYTDPWHPRTADVVGRVWFRVSPVLRWLLLVVAGLAVVVLVIAAWPRRRKAPSLDVPAGPTPASAGERVRRLARAGAPGPTQPSEPSAGTGVRADPTTATTAREPAPPSPVEPSSVVAVVTEPPVATLTSQGPAATPPPLADGVGVSSPVPKELKPESVTAGAPSDSYWTRSRRRVGARAPVTKRRLRRRKDAGPTPGA
jgi:signal peptidase I